MPFPIQDLDFIAPYWFDSGFPLNICNESLNFNETDNLNTTSFVNESSTSCRYSNTVYYGSRYSSSLQNRATREIRAAFFDAERNFFNAYNIFVVTWVITDTKDDLPDPKVISYVIYLPVLLCVDFLYRKMYFSAFLLMVDQVLM